jgi:iron-regulated transporter 1
LGLQVCNLCAPILAGQLLQLTSYQLTALVVAGWNVVSGLLELLLLRAIHSSSPALQQPKEARSEVPEGAGGPRAALAATWRAWVAYIRHPVRNAGLGLAFLFMTVLGFDSITWSYCLLQGVAESTLGLLTGLSGLLGVTGARLYPLARWPGMDSCKAPIFEGAGFSSETGSFP